MIGKTFKFSGNYFHFPRDEVCFTIRKGVKTDWKEGDNVSLWENRYRNEKAKIRNVMHMRVCDLIDDQALMRSWHLYDLPCDPIDTLYDIYPNLDENEIVTLVWFIVRD